MSRVSPSPLISSTSAAFPEQPASTVWRFGDDEAPFIPAQPYPECFLLLRSCMSVSAFLEKCETVQSPSFEIRGKP